MAKTPNNSKKLSAKEKGNQLEEAVEAIEKHMFLVHPSYKEAKIQIQEAVRTNWVNIK